MIWLGSTTRIHWKFSEANHKMLSQNPIQLLGKATGMSHFAWDCRYIIESVQQYHRPSNKYQKQGWLCHGHQLGFLVAEPCSENCSFSASGIKEIKRDWWLSALSLYRLVFLNIPIKIVTFKNFQICTEKELMNLSEYGRVWCYC